MAAVAALAKEDWKQIKSLITDHGNGSFSVKLFDATDLNNNGHTGWESFTFSGNILSQGFDMAQLSNDTDSQGRAEIWTILLEKAWAELNGGYGEIEGGASSVAWQALTGQAGTYISGSGKTDQQIWDIITNALTQGKQVAIQTYDNPAGQQELLILPNGKKVHGDHTYVVLGTSDSDNDGIADQIDLFNPWGSEHIKVPLGYLSEITETLHILGL